MGDPTQYYCVPGLQPHLQEVSMPGELKLGMDGGGLRHSLDGRAVSAGTPLDLQLEDGTWLAGTYEWSFDEAKPPFLSIRVAGTEEPATLRLPARATLRWPE